MPSEPVPVRKGLVYRFVKRALDLSVAVLLFILVLPVFLICSLWVKLDSRGPIFYRARRVGRNGREFRMLKFRSMVVNADKIGGPTTAEDDPRVTSSGRALRRLKLDELPQILNIVKGDMSLVGPRPDVPSEVAKLDATERATIFSMRPGMTDWASIRYYNEAEIVRGFPDSHKAYEELIRPGKIELQMRYVREASFWTDVGIMWSTFVRLFHKPKDAPARGPATAPRNGQT